MAHQSDGPALSLGLLGMGTAVCGGGHDLEVVEELALADNCLQIRQTQRTPENANRANIESRPWRADQTKLTPPPTAKI